MSAKRASAPRRCSFFSDPHMAVFILIVFPPLVFGREEDIQKMLAAQVHIGTRNSDSQMQDYIWRRRQVLFDHSNINKQQTEYALRN